MHNSINKEYNTIEIIPIKIIFVYPYWYNWIYVIFIRERLIRYAKNTNTTFIKVERAQRINSIYQFFVPPAWKMDFHPKHLLQKTTYFFIFDFKFSYCHLTCQNDNTVIITVKTTSILFIIWFILYIDNNND